MNGPLRIIFSVTLLLMWTIFGLSLANDAWTTTNWLMLGLAFLGCSVIFINFAYVFSYGYAISMLIIHLAILALRPSLAAALIAGLGAAYGARLWRFTHVRYRNATYGWIKARGDKADAALPVALRLYLWVAVSWLMTFTAMSAWRVSESGVLSPWIVAGALVMLAGLLLETVADQQKQAGKTRNPDGFVSDGLYRRIRHPNYAGEMIFQVGLMLACIGSAQSWLEYAACLIGPGYIVILMYYAGVEADEKQQHRYGADPAYGEYRQRSGAFLPGKGQPG
jgi:steroid 5-alpha reductase family enzyme